MGARDALVAMRALTFGDRAYYRKVKVRGRSVRLQNRGPGARMGRFGGGWERNVGVQMGRNGPKGTVIINLGKGSIRIDPKAVA